MDSILSAHYLKEFFGLNQIEKIDMDKINVETVVEKLRLLKSVGPTISLVSELDPQNRIDIDTQKLMAISQFVMNRVKNAIENNMTDDVKKLTLPVSMDAIKLFSMLLCDQKPWLSHINSLGEFFYLIDYLMINRSICNTMIESILCELENDSIQDPRQVYARAKLFYRGIRVDSLVKRVFAEFRIKIKKDTFYPDGVKATFEKQSPVIFFTKATRKYFLDLLTNLFKVTLEQPNWIANSTAIVKTLLKKLANAHSTYGSVAAIVPDVFDVVPWIDLSHELVVPLLKKFAEKTQTDICADIYKKLYMRNMLQNGIKKFRGHPVNSFYVESADTVKAFGLNFHFDDRHCTQKTFTSSVLTTTANPVGVKLSIHAYAKKQKPFKSSAFSIQMRPVSMSSTSAVRVCISYLCDTHNVKYLWWVFKPTEKTVMIKGLPSKISTVTDIIIKASALSLQIHTIEIINL